MVDKEFKKLLCDRFTSAELAEFLDISVDDFVDAFEDDVEVNYEELAEWIGLRGNVRSSSDDES